MATIKAYSDLQQSKKLAEILPLETADMSWVSNGLGKPFARTIPIKGDPEELCVCWSLAALLAVLHFPSLHKTISGWRCDTYKNDNKHIMYGKSKDNPVDACYELILKLHELKML